MGLREKNGKWYYRFQLDGHSYCGTANLDATKRNVSAALQIEAEHRTALLEGRRPVKRAVVREFESAAAEFLEWTKAEYRDHPNSARRIAVSLSSAIAFFRREAVTTIDEARIEKYKTLRINEHEVRDVTLRHDLHALSTFFQYAMKQNWARENPISKVAIPSDAGAVRIHVVTPDEEKKYFAAAAGHCDLCDLGRLMLNQGMRPEEALALDASDVDLERGQLHVREGKTPAARRTLDLTPESREILARRAHDATSWIFPARRKPGEHIARLNNAHDAVAKEAGVAFVLYDLRHTFATRMAEAGVDLATLAAILGHNGLRVVQRYVHPTAGHKKAAMATYAESMRRFQAANLQFDWQQQNSGRVN
jgi:integrase